MAAANDRSEGHIRVAGRESQELESAAVDPVFRGLAIKDNRGVSWFLGECACLRETSLKFNWEISQHVCIRVQRR